MRVRIKKHHPVISEVFPLGFETDCEKTFTKEDKIYKGYSYRHRNTINYVPESIIPKGTFDTLLFVGNNGEKYSSDWFYKCTGKSFTEFVEKIL